MGRLDASDSEDSEEQVDFDDYRKELMMKHMATAADEEDGELDVSLDLMPSPAPAQALDENAEQQAAAAGGWSSGRRYSAG